MMRDDYRRALILLRANQPGLNGHVRLERRTLMGSMQFILSGLGADEGQLQAVMAAKTADGWKLVHIGTLSSDSRGQAGLRWTFDPRNIEGLPLEKYGVLLVLQTGTNGCRTLFTGYVNGSISVDWERLEQIACQQYSATEDNVGQENKTEEEQVSGETGIEEAEAPETTPIFREEQDCGCDETQENMDAPAMSEETRQEEAEPEAVEIAAMNAIPAEPLAMVYSDPLDVPAMATRTALEALGLPEAQRWPEGIEPLREVFASSRPIELSVQPDHVFVESAHAPDCPDCAVGIRAKDGMPVSVAYAIPGEYAQQPPEGLEGYAWKDGYWVVVADAQTGEYLNV